MSVKDKLLLGFNHIVSKAGRPITIRYFNQTIGSVWDDEVVLTQSGNDFNFSGILMPISTRERSYDNLLIEQGKIDYTDSKLYAAGSLFLTSSTLQVKFLIGSYIYSLLQEGTITNQVEGTEIYKKIYLRKITGSLIGEA